MAKKDETPPIYVVRRGNALVPEMAFDHEQIMQLPMGQRIKITAHTGRSPKKLRWYWSFLFRVVRATDCAPSKEALHECVKLETGHTTPIKVKGYTVLVPASIAFGSMSEEEFDTFLGKAIEWIAATYGVTPEQAFATEAA